jgi:multiple sugar transport system substrate-binding protein
MRLLSVRDVGLAATAVGMAVLLSACMGGTGGASDNSKDAAAGYDAKAKVTLTWWTGQTSDAETLSEKLAAEYHAAHPNVTIKTSPGADNTDDLLQKLSAGFTAGTFPDVSYAYGSWAGALAGSGHVQDLTSFVNQPSFGWTELSSAARQTATSGGKVIGIPAVTDNLALYYNKKLFDAAHLAYPTNSWSWDDFRAAAKKLTDKSKSVYGTAYSVSGSEDTTWHLWPLLWQKGGEILNGKKPAFNSAAGVSALEFLRQMAVVDKSMYLDQTDERYSPLFASGHIGMMMSGPWSLPDLKTAHNTSYGVTYLPGFSGDHETISGPDLWVLLNHDDANRAGASRAFIQWLTSKNIDAQWNLGQGNLPLRSSETTTPEYQSYVKNLPGGQVFVDNLKNAKKARPTVAGYDEMSRYVGAAISKVLQGAESPKAALDQAAKQSVGALADS